MIETIPGLPDGVIGFEAVGEVSADDYKDVLIPAVEAALKGDRIRFLYVLGERFEGMSAGAMWEDTKVGFEHLRAWERMALVTDVEWIGHTVKAFGWTIPAQVRVFPVAERAAAEAWVAADAS
ncbi:MAG: STAS/SEC14 domain-containing protein [Chloroflexota bacterium]